MQKFNIDNYDIDKNYVIEASAGTGKTYNVVRIVEKIVEKHGLKDILIVTYTEKACGELKDRISKIKGVDINDANIFTIHGFCMNAIKEFGISANLALSLDMESKDDINTFIERFVRKKEILDDIKNICLEYKKENFKIEDLKNDFINALGKYYLDSNYKEDKNIISITSDTEEIIKKIDCKSEEVNNIISKINIADLKKKILYTKIDDSYFTNFYDILDDLEDALKECENIVSTKGKSLLEELEDNLAIGNPFLYNCTTYKVSKKKTPEQNQAINYMNAIKIISDKIDIRRYLFFKYFKDVYKEYQEYKIKNRIESFDDMLRYVREAVINNPSFKKSLQNRYRFAIIDEFQDTNLKQYDIFKEIFLNSDNHKLIVVGDPKQSIYAFQGADVSVYIKAKDEIAKKGLITSLNKNYRSTKGIVEACNAIFKGEKFIDEDFLECEYKTIEKDKTVFEALYDNKEISVLYATKSAIETEALLKENNGKKDKVSDSINEYDFAKIVSEQIIDLCKKDKNGKTKLQIRESNKEFKNISFSDIAILVRSRAEALPFKNALRKAGIPFFMYKNQDLFRGVEAAHLIAILETLVIKDFTLNNRKVYYKALLTYFFGRNLDDLNDEYFTYDDKEEMLLIQKWRDMASKKEFNNLFDSLVCDSYLLENLKDVKYIETLSIFKQLISYSLDYLYENESIESLIITLKKLSKDLDDEVCEGDMLIEKVSDDNTVQIMTMHASKGLEFPVVICAGGFKASPNCGKVFISHNNKNPKLVFERDRSVKEFENEEHKRLEYVAFTRAKYLLMIPKYGKYGYDVSIKLRENLEKNADGLIERIYLKNIKYKTLKEDASKILKYGNTDIAIGNKDEQEKLIKDMIKELPKKKVYMHSYSSLSHSKENEFEDLEGSNDEGLSKYDSKGIGYSQNVSNEDMVDFKNFPKGNIIGSALHEMFELIDFKNYEETSNDIVIKVLKKYGFYKEDDTFIISMCNSIIKNTLEAKISLIQGSTLSADTMKLKDVCLKDRLSEVEFDFGLLKDLNYVNGFIDLIFKQNDVYYIADYKSDSLNEAFTSYKNFDELKCQVDDRYSIQRVLYSYCLIKWLKGIYNISEEEIFEKHFGGIYYIFIKGTKKDYGDGIYSHTWKSYNDLLLMYNEIIKDKVGYDD